MEGAPRKHLLPPRGGGGCRGGAPLKPTGAPDSTTGEPWRERRVSPFGAPLRIGWCGCRGLCGRGVTVGGAAHLSRAADGCRLEHSQPGGETFPESGMCSGECRREHGARARSAKGWAGLGMREVGGDVPVRGRVPCLDGVPLKPAGGPDSASRPPVGGREPPGGSRLPPGGREPLRGRAGRRSVQCGRRAFGRAHVPDDASQACA